MAIALKRLIQKKVGKDIQGIIISAKTYTIISILDCPNIFFAQISICSVD